MLRDSLGGRGEGKEPEYFTDTWHHNRTHITQGQETFFNFKPEAFKCIGSYSSIQRAHTLLELLAYGAAYVPVFQDHNHEKACGTFSVTTVTTTCV